MRRLVLASASPRRRELLAGLGLAPLVRPAAIDEAPRPAEAPAQLVRRLAVEKALHRAADDELVLAADTVVVVDGEVLGKPHDDTAARRMLARLAGRAHDVLTGVALHDGGSGRSAAAVETTSVHLAPLSAADVDWYVASGEGRDKAGGYAVQGLAALFVTRIEGSYSNVVGLPLARLPALFHELGHELRSLTSSGS